MKKSLRLLLIILLVLCFAPINYARAIVVDDVEDQAKETNQDDGTVLCSVISSPKDLQYLIDTDVAFSSQDVITSAWSGVGTPHKIVVKERGWIFITVYEKSKYTDCYLYSNFSLTSKIAQVRPFSDDTNVLACYVEPGSYYYQISRWNGFDTSTTTCYVGFMPSSARIKVDKITYSEDKSMATVTFDYDEEYLKNFVEGTIRIVNGSVSYRDIHNGNIWKTNNKENALESNVFKATSNGMYTARIAGSINDNYFCDVTFEITDILSDIPAPPKISSLKSGTQVITGTGLPGSNIYVTINGKYYSAKIESNRKWKIVSNTKLKKGTKIKAYIKNSAGTKSKSITVTVK